MHVRLDAAAFATATAFAAQHCAPRPAAPALAGLLLETGDRSLTLTGYDAEACATVTVPAEVRVPGRALAPGRVLSDIAKAWPPGLLELAVVDTVLELRADRVEFGLPLLDAGSYPELPAAAPTAGVVSGGELHDAVDFVCRAALRDDVLPVLAGVSIVADGDRLLLTATDRYRIARRPVAWVPSPDAPDVPLVVPARLLAAAARAMSGHGPVHVGWAARPAVLTLSVDDRCTTLRLVDGQFPRVDSHLRTGHVGRVVVRCDELVRAVRRVAPAAEHPGVVVLDTRGDGLVVRATGPGGLRGTEQLDAVVEGDRAQVAFAVGYLLDGLQLVDDEWVTVSYAEGLRPASVTGGRPPAAAPSAWSGGSPDVASVADGVYVVMPRLLPAAR